MKNGNIKENNTMNKLNIIPNRQSAGVHAPQRIHAKDLWYILGLIEGDASFSCYMEKKNLRAEMAIGLERTDIKLLYKIKKLLGHGQIKLIKTSNKTNKLYARYIIRSKIFLANNLLDWFEKYPPLTINKAERIQHLKKCIKSNALVAKNWEIEKEPNNLNIYFNDWIIGFIEAEGSFYFVRRSNKWIAEFNIGQMKEKELLEKIGKQMGISLTNKVSEKRSGYCILTAVSLKDIQAVIKFMYSKERVRLKGFKKVKFQKWISKLRVNPRYSGLKIPLKY